MIQEIDRRAAGYIPELADGFDSGLEALADGLEVKGFYEGADGPGVYRVSWKIRANEAVESLLLFTGRKNLCFLGALKEGEMTKGSCYTHIGEIIPRYYEETMAIEKVCFTAACDDMGKLEFLDIRIEKVPESEVPVIYLAGDSTVTDQSCEIPYNPGTCYSSWGQDLTYYIGSCGAVDNQAHCGLSTETFRQEGHYGIVERAIRPGDYCLFQFGHNDQKLPYLQAETGYRDNLIRFLEEIRHKGGIPVLVTPLGRNTWKEGVCEDRVGKECAGRTGFDRGWSGEYNDLLKEHAEAVKKIGLDTGTPVIDLHEFSVEFYLKNGKEKSRDYFHPADATHTNEYGAYLFAGVIADGLKEILKEALKGRMSDLKETDFSFVPEDSVWDRVNAGKGGRNKTQEQKEQFDAVEKSVDHLIAVVEQAKREGKEKFDGRT